MFNMCNLKIAYKIMAFVILSLIFIGIVGYTGYYFTNQTNLNMSKMYSERLLPTYELNSLQTQFRGNEANLLYLIHYSNNKKLQDERNKDIEKRVSTAKQLLTEYNTVKLTPEEQKKYMEFKKFYESYKPIRQKVLQLALAGKSKEASDLFIKNNKLFDQITTKLADLSELNTALAKQMKEDSQKDYQLAINSIIITILIAAIIAFIFGLALSLGISRPINKLMKTLLEVSEGNLIVDKLDDRSKDEIGKLSAASNKMVDNLKNLVKEVINSVQIISADSEEMNAAADQTAQGAEQVANSVTQLANGATQISCSISELANGANEIVKSVEKGAENINSMDSVINKISAEANNIAILTSNTEQNANEGSQYVKKAVNKIGSIKEVATEISNTINDLGQLGSEIEQIVDLIKGIASQTNLLALNAAIEAARAGEHGKGFAVVAEEVKKLAGQSADATDKITTMVKDIQNKTNVAVDIMNKTVHEVDEGVIIINDAGSALENIIDKVKEANTNIQFVTKEIGEVAQSSKVVVEMVQKISKITDATATNAQEIAAITEETAASAEEISSVTEEQTSSLEEINNSTKSLVRTVEALQEKISSFKVEDNANKPERFYAEKFKLNKLPSLEFKTA